MTRQLAIEYVATEMLRPNPWNSNQVGPEMEARLKNSLAELDFYKPILVRQLSDGVLQILGGEHRWRCARDMGRATVPVINLGEISDKRAKIISLADNAQYGEDDTIRLSQVLRDIGEQDIATMLPYSEEDLAGMFAAASVDLDALGFDRDEDSLEAPDLPSPDAPRKTITHELMRFKVPVEDRERVQRLIEKVIEQQGLKSEADSLVAAGMALVIIANAAKKELS